MQTSPFPSAEAAWLWTSAALRARHAGHPPPCIPGLSAASPAPAPEEVLRCLDDIYRRRRIVLLHARVLRHYGEKGRAPVSGRPRERCDLALWREAMEHLGDKLRQRGLVGPELAWGLVSHATQAGA